MPSLNFDQRPILVFWETTRSCLLACRHCRAEAIPQRLPGELSTAEGMHFIDSLTDFGRPYPVLIMTGGDVLMRPDAFDLAEHAVRAGIPVGLAPSVTPNLTIQNIRRMKDLGIKVVSISLDGATPDSHDGIRGVDGHFRQTVEALELLASSGITVQVNTVVMRQNVYELPAVVKVLRDVAVRIWEVFYLISVGRGRELTELNAFECEDVANFLFDCSMYDLTVRTVEAPFFRRVAAARRAADHDVSSAAQAKQPVYAGTLYHQLRDRLMSLMGPPTSEPHAQTSGTRDGKGIIFVSYDGIVYPSGFLPISLGNAREQSLTSIYRDHPLLRDIRMSRFTGECGTCEYADACGGSRSRAFAKLHDPLASDPACAYRLYEQTMQRPWALGSPVTTGN